MDQTGRGNERWEQETALPATTGSLFSDRLRHPLVVLLMLGLLAALAYSNTFSVPFQFDDKPNIVDNPRIKYLSNMLDLSGSRYIGFLTFALNYHWGGLSVFGYHLGNLLIHLANGCLVYWLVRLLFKTPNIASSLSLAPPSHWIALATAGLFVTHPVQTQAVTYIVQRFASLATLFYLLTVVCYLNWRLSQLNTQNKKLNTLFWYAGALLATGLAMKTKENTFTLPFLLLLMEAVFFGPLSASSALGGGRRRWLGLLPFLLTLLIIPLSRSGALGEGEVGLARETMDMSRLDYLFTQFRVVVTYLRLLIFPVQQNLDYDYPLYRSLLAPPVLLSFLFLLGLGGGALSVLLRRRAPSPIARLMAFGVLWFFLTLSIESSIIPIRDVIYEHRLYLPSVGIFLAGSGAAFWGAARRPRWGAVGVAGLVVLLAIATYERNEVWQSETTLWQDVVQKSPHKARGYNNLGASLADQDKWKEAINEYQTAFNLHPNDVVSAQIHTNVGYAYTNLDRLDEAIQEFKTAINLKPDLAQTHNNLGNVYKKQGRFEEAIREFEEAFRLDPQYADAHNNLGLAYQAQGKLDAALQQFEAAITLNPDFAEAYNNQGIVESKRGRLEQAITQFEKALTLNPRIAGAHNNLGIVYNKLGRTADAMREYQAAITLKPDYTEAHNNLANVYHTLQRLDQAVREYQTAISLSPDYAKAHYNLGVVYDEQGQFSHALEELEKAVQLNFDDALAHNNLGVVYQDLGRVDNAIREFQTALNQQPLLVEAHYNLGKAYQQIGQTHEAIRTFERLLQIQPGNERARQALHALLQGG